MCRVRLLDVVAELGEPHREVLHVLAAPLLSRMVTFPCTRSPKRPQQFPQAPREALVSDKVVRVRRRVDGDVGDESFRIRFSGSPGLSAAGVSSRDLVKVEPSVVPDRPVEGRPAGEADLDPGGVSVEAYSDEGGRPPEGQVRFGLGQGQVVRGPGALLGSLMVEAAMGRARIGSVADASSKGCIRQQRQRAGGGPLASLCRFGSSSERTGPAPS